MTIHTTTTITLRRGPDYWQVRTAHGWDDLTSWPASTPEHQVVQRITATTPGATVQVAR